MNIISPLCIHRRRVIKGNRGRFRGSYRSVRSIDRSRERVFFSRKYGTNVRLVRFCHPALSRLIKLAIQLDAFRHPFISFSSSSFCVSRFAFCSRDEWGSFLDDRDRDSGHTDTRVTCKFAFTWKRRGEIIAEKILGARCLSRKIDRYLVEGERSSTEGTIKNRVRIWNVKRPIDKLRRVQISAVRKVFGDNFTWMTAVRR